MDGAEDDVAGVGRLEGRPHRLGVAELADEDHVWILAEDAAKGVGEGRRVAAELALGDEALLGFVEELDRILDRDDAEAAGAVEVVDHRCQRRALAAAGCPGDEHQPAGLLGDLVEDRRQGEIGKGLDPRRDRAGDEG